MKEIFFNFVGWDTGRMAVLKKQSPYLLEINTDLCMGEVICLKFALKYSSKTKQNKNMWGK